MSSAVYYKFKSQKEPSRVTFDGNEISVFELKKEIISLNKLGSGTDFDLAIYNADTNDEYDDDLTVIPRASTVIARRLPPKRPGHGTGARYVTGKMPLMPNAARRENFASSKPVAGAKPGMPAPAPPMPGMGGNEDDMTKAFFAASGEQWKQTQAEMMNQTPVFRNNARLGKPANVPDHPPPSGYVCYRCGEKGHWIQQCPTNLDPNYDRKARVRRTTGIPRSMLRTVAKPAEGEGGTVLVNPEGEYVIAVADEASWENYQQRAKQSQVATAPKDPELECELCHSLVRDPVRTPCCKKLFCEECIQDALLESDFICPMCGAQDILLDRLEPDYEIRRRAEEYEKNEKLPDQASEAGTLADGAGGSKKRSAEDEDEEPSSKRQNTLSPTAGDSKSPTAVAVAANGANTALANQASASSQSATTGPGAPVPNQADFQGYGMDGMMGGMPPGMMPPFMMPPGMMPPGMMQMMMMNGMMGGPPQMMQPQQPQPSAEQQDYYNKYGYFPTQQLNYMNSQGGDEEDDGGAYLRKPVNPHRVHRQKRFRPSDFREL